MPKLFGTDGIRGKAGLFPIDPASMKILGYMLASIIVNSPYADSGIYIGYDTRESASSIFNNLVEGLQQHKCTVYHIGIAPTPLISFISLYKHAFSIAITASHNPYEDNGIKIIGPDGLKISEELASEIEQAILKKIHLPFNEVNRVSLPIDYGNEAFSLYNEELIRKNFNDVHFNDTHLAVDVANGAAYKVIPSILKQHCASVVVFNNSPDGKNINEKCGALFPEFLVEKIKHSNIDLGISYDGDADRAIFCDASGNIYDGDMVLAVIGNYLKQRRKLNNN